MITAEHLTKRYGHVTAVDDVSFQCEPGTITGFLGPNGAGKSTALRMLTGLSSPTSGRATIGGSQYADLPNPGRLVGVMLDAAAQHPGRTGLETLSLAARVMGLPRRRATEMLEQVDIADAARRRVGTYSLGMRQRLGIASALLGYPQMLILDEPANGMDPAGIRWMRSLLRDFAGRGGTVLLSSHLLGEIQATADHLVVIEHGRVVAQGALQELLHHRGTVARGTDPDGLNRAMRSQGLSIERTDDGAFLIDATPEQVGRVAASAGQILIELRENEAAGLEEIFFELTGHATTGIGASNDNHV
ncbi:ABC transporter ATP-binding protein [Cumulibacter soli]|uniref:ABC transporter ATP-binding protein n=1 Tax=Cumulibacter soli TaxID=2546344 RepID=UPI0010689616|nr:ATP-binding cassette domain-containing protein [Cumulibacter soli]